VLGKHSLKILLFEDHHSWQQILQDYTNQALQAIGHRGDIRIATTVDEALDALDQESQWHLLITDINEHKGFPSLGGTSLIKRAHALSIPCIVVSGTSKASKKDVVDILKKRNAGDFIDKTNFDREHFIQTIQTILEQKNISD
jgi:CheY-like chemotaxis protein